MNRFAPAWTRCGGIFDVADLAEKVAALDAKAVEPGFWDDPNKARAVIDETNRYRAVLKPFDAVASSLEDAELMIELSEQEEDAAQRNQAVKDVAVSLDGAEKDFERLEMQSLLSGELDGSNAYLTLHAGAGGTESCDWAEMLLRMYRYYCEHNGLSLEILELSPGDEAGIKSATILVSADFAYGYLKAERGVHRLVRISPFDSAKRRHTSFVALDVVAEVADDIDVEILDEDLRVDTYRSSGAGGQHVNTTDSAVRITHLPTGIVVACQAERSQHKNRAKAMKMLRARVYEWKLDQTRKDMEKFYGEKGEIAWGSQIRSYVLQPYTMVKDHRTSEETSNVSAVLDGALQPFIEAYLKKQAAELRPE